MSTDLPNAARGQVVDVDVGEVMLEGELAIPQHPRGIVLFAHGSGSSRHSPRNKAVAEELQEGRLATLLMDLLTPEEERIDLRTRHLRFDIPMLARRLAAAVDWLGHQPETADLDVGLFGSSTGGGAAIIASAQRPDRVRAVVSRGGRPDLAGDALRETQAPTLLIVGGLDTPVVHMNEDARAQMVRARTRLEIIPGATHLFEEPGKLTEVAKLARDFFVEHLHARAP